MFKICKSCRKKKLWCRNQNCSAFLSSSFVHASRHVCTSVDVFVFLICMKYPSWWLCCFVCWCTWSCTVFTVCACWDSLLISDWRRQVELTGSPEKVLNGTGGLTFALCLPSSLLYSVSRSCSVQWEAVSVCCDCCPPATESWPHTVSVRERFLWLINLTLSQFPFYLLMLSTTFFINCLDLYEVFSPDP